MWGRGGGGAYEMIDGEKRNGETDSRETSSNCP